MTGMSRLALLFAVVALGCGNGATMMTGPDMGHGPTDHPPLWQMVKGTGSVQAAPEIYVVVWQGYETKGQELADFADWMVTSEYWGLLQEYGVGAGRGMGEIVLAEAPPATVSDAGLRARVESLVVSGMLKPNDNTQVHFIIPKETKDIDGGCSVFLGYHDSVSVSGQAVAYAVNMQCDPLIAGNITDVTATLSHEAAEAATDPRPFSGWLSNGSLGEEVADLCSFVSLPIDVPADATHPARRYYVQRLYSSQLAMQGDKDPCVPLPTPDRPFWGVALDPPEVGGSTVGGATVSARLVVFAYGDVGEIKWFAGATDPTVTVEPSEGVAQVGDVIPVVISQDPPKRNAYEIDIEAQSAKAGGSMWIGTYLLQ